MTELEASPNVKLNDFCWKVAQCVEHLPGSKLARMLVRCSVVRWFDPLGPPRSEV